MIILDERITLRKPELNDLEDLFIVKNSIEAKNLLGGFNHGYSKEDIKKWIEFHSNKDDEIIYLIEINENKKVIGHVGLYNIDHRVRKAEFAILIGDITYWGKGIGNTCTSYMIHYAFDELNLQRLELSLLANNERALKLYQKCSGLKKLDRSINHLLYFCHEKKQEKIYIEL